MLNLYWTEMMKSQSLSTKWILLLLCVNVLQALENHQSRSLLRVGEVLTSCNFNDDSIPFCNFRQDTNDHSDWIRHKGPTPTNGTGPSGDYPDGNGYYIYHEADNVADSQMARLLSPPLMAPSGQACIQFWYYMYGLDANNLLSVLIKRDQEAEELVWDRKGLQSHSWLKAEVSVSMKDTQQFVIIFQATRGTSSSCDTALDNITISNGPCSSCLVSCDFDKWDDLCGWQNPGGNLEPWVQWIGNTDTEGTGPDDDFSKPGFGMYMLLDSLYGAPGVKGELRSPLVLSDGCLEFSFYYYMYGTANTMQLNVYATTSGTVLGNSLFTRTGNQGKGWKLAEVRFNKSGQVQFVIEGVYGETDKTDIAVDSVCIAQCQAVPPTTARPPPQSSTILPTASTFSSTNKPSTGSTAVSLSTTSEKPTTVFATTKPSTYSIPTQSTVAATETDITLITSSVTSTSKTTFGSTTTKGAILSTTEKTTIASTATVKPTIGSTFTMKPTTVLTATVKPSPTTSIPATYSTTVTLVTSVKPSIPTTDTSTASTVVTAKPSTQSTTVKGTSPMGTTQPTTFLSASSAAPINPSTYTTTSVTSSASSANAEKPSTDSLTTTNKNTSSTTIDATTSAKLTTLLTERPTTSTSNPTFAPTMTTKPPVICPPNSHYVICGPSCFSTCETPNPNCTGSCTTGCFCDPGYLYQGSKCVPVDKCGCISNGIYFEPGQVILEDDCSQVCRCVGNYTFECTKAGCLPNEECRNVNGVPSCYPKDSSTCIVTGDPHYATFDRRHYDFMGNCSYILSKPCNDSQGQNFTVYADNEHRYGQMSVTFLRAVHIETQGVVVTILKGGTAQVDGISVNLPFNPKPEVLVFQSGRYIQVETSFGLTVRYDGNNNADIKVTSEYKKTLCGLCGDYDGNPNNDFKTPQGDLVPGVNDFGDSWNINENCIPTEGESGPQCTDDEKELYQSSAYCGLLLDPKGPFAACHSRVNPNNFFANCLFDVCELGGAHPPLCEALESYTSECQERNVTVGAWRNDTFCPLRCPTNSHYDPCVSPCQPSCLQIQRELCRWPCAEGCICDKGFVLSGGHCVKQDSCGCQFNGNYYKPGDKFFTNGCQHQCQCIGSNVTTCNPWSCSNHEICSVVNGELGCHPTGSAPCYVSGDPHYMSFDQRMLSFMGTCTYTLARSCKNNTGPWFSIEGKNEERGMMGVSYLRKLYITVNGITITLMKGRRTLVNDVRVQLPYSPSRALSIAQAGQYVIVRAIFGLSVRWDGSHFAEIIVPSSYYDQMCGLCGNYNGDPKDDFIKPNGEMANNSDEFGNSWQTQEDEDKVCQPDNEVDPPCDEQLYNMVADPDHCGKILDANGPFRDCLAVVKPDPYFQNCIYDMCRYEGLQQTLCDQLQAYTDACLTAGAAVHNWRGPTFCPLPCPPNSHYSLCASLCPQSCGTTSPLCSSGCIEGCECDPGFILSDSQCVHLSHCGCMDENGSYHSANESWYLPGCMKRCTCLGQNIIHCESTSCTAMEKCELLDGMYGCYTSDRQTCSASGDPHYTTYDRATHHFQGSCSYILSQPCQASSFIPYFSVETENERRGNNQHVSYVRAVRVNVYGQQVILGKGREIMVNGVQVSPPVHFGDWLMVRLSGTFVMVTTDFGLWVRFDGNHHADVSVPSFYSGHLCGLCGNYNGNPSDDNLKPDGLPAGNTNELGESWQAYDNRTECSHDGGISPCDQELENEAKKPTSCGMISDPKGVFQMCHAAIPPDAYFENCVYDVCGTGGDAVALCLALQSYADLCAQAGVPITWRNNTSCSLKCPPGSHYSPCGVACPPSCTELDAPNSCDLPCVEGCVCDSGLVLSGYKCVPFKECGCVDQNNNYHPVGDSWHPGTDCSKRCTCSPFNNITCQDWQCSPEELCQVQDGVLACHSQGGAVCHVAGDPHYYTFDHIMHTFMGTCTYTLVDVCNSSMVTPFTIVAKNEERGQPMVSYVRSVSVKIHGSTVTLNKGRRILVDGQRVLTPLAGRIPGVSLLASGVYSVLETDFGLVVKFDGVHHLEINIPGAYFNKVCGMCGNYNGYTGDELLMPNGQLAKDEVQLGNSWKSEGDSDPGCQPDDREDLNAQCGAQDKDYYSKLCSDVLIKDKNFLPCHSIIKPEAFVENCIFDMCEYQGMMATLCDNVEAYAQACQGLGITVKWRNSTFCPLPCPPNSHYLECSAPCPPTCANLYAEASCGRPLGNCVEGCQCNAGFVLSDGLCVPLKSCGCVDNQGEYHNVGDYWLTRHCEEECRCQKGGVPECSSFQCNDHSYCALNSDGNRYCKPDKFDKCIISGDPHYRTFDNFVHHYQGKNTYVLVKTFNLPSSFVPFTINGQNKQSHSNRRVSFLYEVHIDVYGYSIRLLQDRKLLVNGENVQVPLRPTGGLHLFQQSRAIILETDFGLKIRFDGREYAEVVLPITYSSRVRGLCGNYDGRKNNDYMMPDGSITRNLNIFGDSWEVRNGQSAGNKQWPAQLHHVRREVEEEPESGFETQGCTKDQLQVINGTYNCGALSNPMGVFNVCHTSLSPQDFQENCVFDLCAESNNAVLRCLSFEVYAQACQEGGVKLGNWRQELDCALSCHPNSVYSSCMSACPATCANLAAPSECETTVCMEGCECKKNFVLSGQNCVPFNQCGCTFQERYYLLNEKFVSEDCTQSCTCMDTGADCKLISCAAHEVCTVYNYTRGCFRDGPCLSSPCNNGGTCLEEGNGFKCICPSGFKGMLCEEVHSGLDETTIILIGVLVPLAVVIIAVLGICIYQRYASRKIWKVRNSEIDLKSIENPNYKKHKTSVTKF
ncbi:zonadhesin, like [Erpetoichthys calabaricus]|uniref:zonadhesin, like n=1 Tax=Erpetoichthys calabaricus TaxID=27687 RepID=UPI00223418E1|nr:zonadhesin, like [Erpetoichthys calabaricus]